MLSVYGVVPLGIQERNMTRKTIELEPSVVASSNR